MILVLLGLPVKAHSARPPTWVKEQINYVSSHAPVPSSDQVGWTILSSEIHVALNEQGRLSFTYRKIWRLNDLKEQSLSILLPYDDTQQALSGPMVWVQKRRSWKNQKLKGQSVDVPDLSGPLVTGGRRLVISTDAVAPGRVVAASWTLTDRLEFPSTRVFSPLETLSVERFKVTADSNVRLFYNPVDGAVRDVTTGGLELWGLPSASPADARADAWRRSPLDAFPIVTVMRGDVAKQSWPDLALRVRALFDQALLEEADHGGPDYPNLAHELSGHLESRDEKIAALTAFVQSLTYRNIAWGAGAYTPDHPTEVLRTMSADCKAKTLLLHGLLEQIGVASTPVLVRLDQQYLAYSGPPTVSIFNHVVLAIHDGVMPEESTRLKQGPGRGSVLIDATDPIALLGATPYGLLGSEGLWLGEGGGLFKIEVSTPPSQQHARLTVDMDGFEKARFRLEITGGAELVRLVGQHVDAASGRLTNRSRRIIQQRFSMTVSGLVPDEIMYMAADQFLASPASLVMSGYIDLPAARLSGDRYAVGGLLKALAVSLDIPLEGYDDFSRWSDEEAGPDFRSARCCSAKQTRLLGEVELNVPEGWQVESWPRFEDISADWVEASVSSPESGARWTIKVEGHSGDFGDQSQAARRRDMNQIAKVLRGRVILTSTVP
ncbi:hypothetical protein [Marinihelvus fidelis]|uniref:hypothetical protein n=1 Tax=Marinihelvus fidelis TaxID=2613842 RepID=UPI00178154BF|nr:hypothetical protein [Marinihelvus fidelis]